jgi:hypothetical protein
MIKREMRLAQIKRGHKDNFLAEMSSNREDFIAILQNQGCATFSLFEFGSLLFAYYETIHEEVELRWEERLKQHLEAWPGEQMPRYSVPLLDIFHDNKPNREFAWRNHVKPLERNGCIARLKPEMYSSYVFYHYQLQEEKPAGFNKYYMIGSHEKYIFSYEEMPAIIDPAPSGLLQTRNTPDNWTKVMLPHFELWEDVQDGEPLAWKRMEQIIAF